MMHGALNYLINGSNFTTGWIFFIDNNGHHEMVADVDLPGALKKDNCCYMKRDLVGVSLRIIMSV